MLLIVFELPRIELPRMVRKNMKNTESYRLQQENVRIIVNINIQKNISKEKWVHPKTNKTINYPKKPKHWTRIKSKLNPTDF